MAHSGCAWSTSTSSTVNDDAIWWACWVVPSLNCNKSVVNNTRFKTKRNIWLHCWSPHWARLTSWICICTRRESNAVKKEIRAYDSRVTMWRKNRHYPMGVWYLVIEKDINFGAERSGRGRGFVELSGCGFLTALRDIHSCVSQRRYLVMLFLPMRMLCRCRHSTAATAATAADLCSWSSEHSSSRAVVDSSLGRVEMCYKSWGHCLIFLFFVLIWFLLPHIRTHWQLSFL